MDLAIPEDAVVEVPMSPGGSASTLVGTNEGEGSVVEDPDAVPFYETPSFQLVMGVATIYALVGEDLMKLTCPPEVDDVLYVFVCSSNSSRRKFATELRRLLLTFSPAFHPFVPTFETSPVTFSFS